MWEDNERKVRDLVGRVRGEVREGVGKVRVG